MIEITENKESPTFHFLIGLKGRKGRPVFGMI